MATRRNTLDSDTANEPVKHCAICGQPISDGEVICEQCKEDLEAD